MTQGLAFCSRSARSSASWRRCTITAYLKAHCRPLQAIAMGLTVMGGAFLPLLAARTFLPIHTLPGAFGDATTPASRVDRSHQLQPCVCERHAPLTRHDGGPHPLPSASSRVLGGNRLLGTYFGFYYLVQGSGTVVGNLAIGAAFDTGTRSVFRASRGSCCSALAWRRQPALRPWIARR